MSKESSLINLVLDSSLRCFFPTNPSCIHPFQKNPKRKKAKVRIFAINNESNKRKNEKKRTLREMKSTRIWRVWVWRRCCAKALLVWKVLWKSRAQIRRSNWIFNQSTKAPIRSFNWEHYQFRSHVFQNPLMVENWFFFCLPNIRKRFLTLFSRLLPNTGK